MATAIYQKNEIRIFYPTPMGEDIGSSPTITIYIKRPDATLLTKTGTMVDETTGQISWTSINTDLNQLGEYIVQVKWVSGATTNYGPMETFYVDDILA